MWPMIWIEKGSMNAKMPDTDRTTKLDAVRSEMKLRFRFMQY